MAADLSIKPVPVTLDVLCQCIAQELHNGTLWVLINGGDFADRQQLALKLLGLSLFPS